MSELPNPIRDVLTASARRTQLARDVAAQRTQIAEQIATYRGHAADLDRQMRDLEARRAEVRDGIAQMQTADAAKQIEQEDAERDAERFRVMAEYAAQQEGIPLPLPAATGPLPVVPAAPPETPPTVTATDGLVAQTGPTATQPWTQEAGEAAASERPFHPADADA